MTRDDLRAFRALHGLTQQAVAEILGLARGSIIEFEKGRRPLPKWFSLALAAHNAGISPYTAPELARRQMELRSTLRIDCKRSVREVRALADSGPVEQLTEPERKQAI